MTATRLTELEVPGTVRVLDLHEGLLLVGVSSRTNLELVLDQPTLLSTSRSATTADRVGLWVDDPRGVGHQLRSRPHVVDPST